MSNNPFSNNQYNGEDNMSFGTSSSEDLNSYYSSNIADGVGNMAGLNKATFDSASSTLRSTGIREQSVLVKSLFFMCAALVISAISAYFGLKMIYSNPEGFLSLMIPMIIGEIVLVFVAGSFMSKGNVIGSAVTFFLYSVVNGIVLSVVFIAYSLGSIVTIFLITAALFAALAVYGSVTKTDLTPLRSFFFMSLLGIIIGGVVNMFLNNSMFDTLLCVFGVVIFAGITAYDIQKIKNINMENPGANELTVAMYGGLQLYLDFVNIFLKLLRLFGKSRN